MQTALDRQTRDPFAWSLARPGSEYVIEPVVQHPPADLDPHLARISDDRLAVRIITLEADADAMRERVTTGHLLIGLFAAAMLGVVCIATVIGAGSRIPAIEQQLADAARI